MRHHQFGSIAESDPDAAYQGLPAGHQGQDHGGHGECAGEERVGVCVSAWVCEFLCLCVHVSVYACVCVCVCECLCAVIINVYNLETLFVATSKRIMEVILSVHVCPLSVSGRYV